MASSHINRLASVSLLLVHWLRGKIIVLTRKKLDVGNDEQVLTLNTLLSVIVPLITFSY